MSAGSLVNLNSGKERVRKHVLILGSGFGGIEVLKKLQKKFRRSKNNVDITLVSKDNFLLFTPMLPEVSTGRIETRHIVTPVRTFIDENSGSRNVRFHEAKVECIDLAKKRVIISHNIGGQTILARSCNNTLDIEQGQQLEQQPQPQQPQPQQRQQEGQQEQQQLTSHMQLQEQLHRHTHTLNYDYLVIALGSDTNFFGIDSINRYAFTMEEIDDAIAIRNHILEMLEQADLEKANTELRKRLLTFVIVGGGFNGIETVGELNDFVRESVREYYKNIYMTEIRIVLVNASSKILEQVDDDLGKWALQELKTKGVEFMLNRMVKDVTADSVKLDNGQMIGTYTIIWSAGVTSSKLIADLNCEHDKHHRIIANNHLELKGYEGTVYAVGDCASVIDPNTGTPYPPTAQHALRGAKVAADNLVNNINGDKTKKNFDYKTKGTMAEIGKRTGIATLFGGRIKLHGFVAWWVWRIFYLSNLPTRKKKLKVMSDWTMDLFFKPDVAKIERGKLCMEGKIEGDQDNLKKSIREAEVQDSEQRTSQK